jgi:small conductance mechanosensitive channel
MKRLLPAPAAVVALAFCLLVPNVGAQSGTSDAAAGESLAARARALSQSIERDWTEWHQLLGERDGSEGEERVLLDRRLLRKGLDTLAGVDEFVTNVLEQERQGLDAAEFREQAEQFVRRLAPVARQRIELLQQQISQAGKDRESLSGEELIRLETRLQASGEKLDLVIEAAVDNAEHMQALGLPAAEEKAYLARVLEDRAEVCAERIPLAIEQTDALQQRLEATPGDAELEAQLAAVEKKKEASRASLATTIELMDRLELDTAEYRKVLIQSTGEITADILDSDVALGLLRHWLSSLEDWLVDRGPGLVFKILVFVLILFVFHLLSRLTRRVVASAVQASKLDFSQLLQKMFVSTSGNAVLAIGLLVALSQMGFALGPILAGLGIAGFIVGFALQETLGNFAAGMMILIYRPFDVDDMIEAAGVFGKVGEMNMVSTTILTIDNQTLVVPNGKIWGDVIKNVTAQHVRRVDMVFGVSYSDDIPHTETVLAAILSEHPKVLDDPAPMIKLHKLGESSVDFVVRPWVRTEDYWEVYWDVTREVKMRFDREGISIPFPQRDVHFYEERRLASGSATDRTGG